MKKSKVSRIKSKFNQFIIYTLSLILLIGCVPGSNVNLTQGSRGLPGIFPGIQAHQNSSAMQSVSDGVSEQQRMQELIQKIKNKTPYAGPIDIKIDTGLLDKNNADRKVLTVKSSAGGFSTQAVPAGPIVFQEQFVRDKNPIKGEKRDFTVSDTSKIYTLHIQNGDAQGNNTVSSAVISINGQDWVRPNDFRGKQTLEVQKDSILLNANNTMTIDISGSPGSTMIVTVIEGGQAGTIRRKNGPLNEHPDQATHVKSNDRNIFDPADPNSLSQLTPFEGDFISPDGVLKVASGLINGTDDIQFQSGEIILELKNPISDLAVLQSLYDATVVEEDGGFYLIRFNLDKSPIKNAEGLIRLYTSKAAVNITEAIFSSLASYKTFILMIDLIVNHNDLFKSIDLDLISQPPQAAVPPVETNDWADNYPTGDANLGLSWWLTDTKTLEAWNYSIGSGALASSSE